MNSTLSSLRPTRRLVGAVLLASLAFSPQVRAQSAKPAPSASKKSAEAAQSAESATPKVALASKAPAVGQLPAAVKSRSSQKLKANPSKQAAADVPSPALEPSLSPPASERMTEAGAARRRAVIALNTGHYEDAIKGFEEAYALDQDPILLFRLAQAYRLAGQPTKALDACEAYLRSTDKNTSERGQVEQFVVEMEMIAYQIRLQREYGMLPRPGLVPPLVPPPAHSPSLAGETRTSLSAPKLEASRSAELTQAPAPSLVESPPFYKRTYFWVAVGGVVAAGATAAIWYAASSHGSRAPQTALGYQGAYQ